MAVIKEAYPLNFDFNLVDLNESTNAVDFVNRLHSQRQYEVVWNRARLFIRFTNLLKGVGLPAETFKIFDESEASKLLGLLLKGVNRLLKTTKLINEITNEDILIILQSEGRSSIIDTIMNKIDALIYQLKIEGSVYIKDLNAVDVSKTYVSNIILSWYFCDRLSSGRTFAPMNFWEHAVYNGTVNDHKRCLNQVINIFSSLNRGGSIILFFPLGEYEIITPRFDEQSDVIRFTEYRVEFLPDSVDCVESRIDDTSLMHLLPHYGIYHLHRFGTKEDLTRYLEWSVYRSQKERDSYRGSQIISGLRCTRGSVLGHGSSEYNKFLNFLLFQSLYVKLDVNAATSSEWSGYLLVQFKELGRLMFSNDFNNYECNGSFGVPRDLYNYISNQEINTSTHSGHDICILKENLLQRLFKNEMIVPKVQILGRETATERQDGEVVFSELPSGDPISMIDVEKFGFTHRYDYNKINEPRVIKSREYLGRYIMEADVQNPPVNPNSILENITRIRNLNRLRVHIDNQLSRIGSSRFWWHKYFKDIIQAREVVSIGEAILFLSLSKDGSADRAIEEISDFPYYYDLSTKSLDSNLSSFDVINGSTCKIASVLSTLFWFLKNYPHVSIKGNEIFRKVCILGTVGKTDPIARGLKRLFDSIVVQIGAFGVNPTIRARVQDYEFSQGFSTIISDIDLGRVTTFKDLEDMFENTLLYYLQTIRPLLFIWKINYCSDDMICYLFTSIEKKFKDWREYVFIVVYPMFTHVWNLEAYLCAYRVEDPDKQLTHLGFNYHYTGSVIPSFRTDIRYESLQVESMDMLLHPNNYINSRLITTMLCKERELYTCLSVHLYNSTIVALYKNRGSEFFTLIGAYNLSRFMFTRRVGILYGISNDLAERYESSLIPTGGDMVAITIRYLELGDMIRALIRMRLFQNTFNIDNLEKFKYEDVQNYCNDISYIGVGDERALNVVSVPCSSKYYVIDDRAHMNLMKYGITIVDELFPWKLEDAEILLGRISKEDNNDFVLYFLFMLYNDNPEKTEMLRRLSLLGRLLRRNLRIREIICNVYLTDPIEDILKTMPDNGKCFIYGDIQLECVLIDGLRVYSGTFGERYDPVCLISRAEVINAMPHDIKITWMNLNSDVINLTIWINGCYPSIAAFGGLCCGYSFAQPFRLRRDE